MTDAHPVDPSQIERHFEQVLSSADEANLTLVRDVLEETPDRWYGQLVVSAYDSLSGRQDREAALPAAAAVELLRGYVRLRSRLFVTLTDDHAHSLTLDPTAALLAGDYLYTAAFSSLRSAPNSTPGDCFGVLTSCLETITEAFACTYTPPESTEYATVLGETAGSLGAGAAGLGAALAGGDGPTRRHCERLGRGLSTAKQVNHVLDTDPSDAIVVPATFDEAQFRRHAKQGRDEAARALDTMPEAVDVTRLRAFADATATKQDQRR